MRVQVLSRRTLAPQITPQFASTNLVLANPKRSDGKRDKRASATPLTDAETEAQRGA